MRHPRLAPAAPLALACAAALAAVLLPSERAAVADKEKEDVANNYAIAIPDTWRWSDGGADWAKYGIRARGYRELEAFKRNIPIPNTEPVQFLKPDGQGGEVTVAVLDAPAGKTLDEIAKDPETRKFLLARFDDDPAKWPTPEVETGTVQAQEGDPVPSITLSANGSAHNLKGVMNPKSRGVLLLAIAKKKLYRVRMFAWPGQWDDEGLKDDIMAIEMDFEILNSKEEKKADEPLPPVANGGAAAPEPESAELKEEEISNVVQKWKLVKPAGLKKAEIDKTTYPNEMVHVEASEKDGSYMIVMSVYPLTTVDATGNQHGGDMKTRIADDWWPQFKQSHDEGEIVTFPWTKAKHTFLTLPNTETPIVIVKETEKRPAQMDYAALVDEKALERIDNPRIRRAKIADAYRGCLMGNRARIGKELACRYYWKTQTHAFEMGVFLGGDVLKAHGPKIQKLLESIEMTGK